MEAPSKGLRSKEKEKEKEKEQENEHENEKRARDPFTRVTPLSDDYASVATDQILAHGASHILDTTQKTFETYNEAITNLDHQYLLT